MRQIITVALLALALSACNEEDDAKTDETTSSSAESTQPAASTENTATADDGGGAMDGTAQKEEQTANISEVSQDAIDSCIDGLRAIAGAGGGTVTGTEFSEANSLVMLQDANGAEWRCLVSNDGSNASLESVGGGAATEDTATADDGSGAIAGSGDGAAPSVGSPTDVTAFQGAPAGQAPGGLAALGFEAMRTEGLTTYWFNKETGACAKITTSDGIFSEVVMVPAEDC